MRRRTIAAIFLIGVGIVGLSLGLFGYYYSQVVLEDWGEAQLGAKQCIGYSLPNLFADDVLTVHAKCELKFLIGLCISDKWDLYQKENAEDLLVFSHAVTYNDEEFSHTIRQDNSYVLAVRNRFSANGTAKIFYTVTRYPYRTWILSYFPLSVGATAMISGVAYALMLTREPKRCPYCDRELLVRKEEGQPDSWYCPYCRKFL